MLDSSVCSDIKVNTTILMSVPATSITTFSPYSSSIMLKHVAVFSSENAVIEILI